MQEKRLEKTILITNRLGLHARASAKFVELISKCKSKFVIRKGKNIVNGSSLLGLMTLAASKGTEIKIQCIGENSQEDLSKLVNLIKNNFGEEKPLSDNIIKEVSFKGIALHSGCLTKIKILPADCNTGVIFIRKDKKKNNIIPANWSNVTNTKLCTKISNKSGLTVSTIEHLMSAISALHIDNLKIEISGQEVPILDGSSKIFF